MDRLSDSVDMVVHGQIFVKSNAEDFDVVSQWDLGACNVDSGKITELVGYEQIYI